MKVRIPHDFFFLVQNYTLESMIKAVSFWSFDIYNNPDKHMERFAGYRLYKPPMHKVLLVQTWLIDLIYDLIKFNKYGHADISLQEALKLIGLYGNYKNDTEHTLYNKRDILIYLYGFFGEQLRFQNNSFFEEFAREKYILEIISKYSEANSYNIDYKAEFFQETSFSTDIKKDLFNSYYLIHVFL